MIRKLWKKFGPNPLDRLLKKGAKQGVKSILIPWNRGMGDVALGLFAIVHRIRTFIPEASITFITRPDLEEPFQLLQNVNVLIDPAMKRGAPFKLPPQPHFDLVLEKADPSHWVAWQRGTLTPKLQWKSAWDDLYCRFNLPQGCVAAHVNCETNYYFERNWPAEKWQELFSSIEEPIILFGLEKKPSFCHPNLFDLRGETSLLEILSILKNCCTALIAPDSGILGLTYFLETPFPLSVVSLWANPNHGILKQNVASPNPLLTHCPVISPDRKNAALIPPQEVKCVLEILTRLQKMNQPHLAEGINTLTPAQQAAFLDQLQPDLLEKQRAIFQQQTTPPLLQPAALAEVASDQWKNAGYTKQVACLILAGGQGSRLHSSLPKALIPITKNKTLLELHLEKVGNHPCAVITSPGNHEQIASFLKTTPFTPTLIEQTEAPFLDEKQNWILRKPGQLASGPDGNGHALHLLKTCGLLKKWKDQNIEIITVIPIENVLADPIDPILIGYHTADITVKVIRRKSSHEKVGIMVCKEDKILVQEYSELADEQQGTLAHTGLFALSLSFVERAASFELPWHLAHKQDPLSGQWIWKFERFMFDILEYSEQTNLLLYPRAEIYAPLKNATGEKSLATVQLALQNRAMRNNR